MWTVPVDARHVDTVSALWMGGVVVCRWPIASGLAQHVVAFRADTGVRVWQTDIPGRWHAGPVATHAGLAGLEQDGVTWLECEG